MKTRRSSYVTVGMILLVVLVSLLSACEEVPGKPPEVLQMERDNARATAIALTPAPTPWSTAAPTPTSVWDSHPNRLCGLSTVACNPHQYEFNGINAEGLTFFEYISRKCVSPYGDQAYAQVMNLEQNAALYGLTANDWYTRQVFYVPGDMMCPVGNLLEN